MSEQTPEGQIPSVQEVSASKPFEWPEEFAGFVERQPWEGAYMVVLNADGSESPTAPRNGSSYYDVQKGYLPGNGKLALVENVRDGQFGGADHRRITSVWEPQRGYSPGHHHKGAGDQERTDIWYDEKSGRPIAMRAAAFDIDKEGVPYIQKPK